MQRSLPVKERGPADALVAHENAPEAVGLRGVMRLGADPAIYRE
jgi:hypothetical protein